MRVGVHVDAVDRLERAAAAGVARDDVGGVEPRGAGGGDELGPELAEGEVRTAALDEAGRSDIPERRGAAVAEHDLVAVGEAEQFGEAVPHAADEVLDGGLAVRGAEQLSGGGEGGDLLGAHLRGSAAEASVGGQKVGGDAHVGHGSSLLSGCGGAVRSIR